MRYVVTLAVVLTAAAVAAGATYAIKATRTVTAPPASFTDPAGDAGTAPDITGISVTNDDHGLYEVTLTFSTIYSGDVDAALYLDTDRNASTGNSNDDGADYLYLDDEATNEYELDGWNGSDWTQIHAGTAAVTVLGGQKSIEFDINKSDLGNTTGFNFWVGTFQGDGSAGHHDFAPDTDTTFAYSMQTVFTLSVGNAQNSPAKTGSTWTVGLNALRSDTGASVGSDATIACSASSGATKLKLKSKAFVSGGGGGGNVAVCQFAVPKTLKKKAHLQATITVSLAGQTVSNTYTQIVK